jgi:hypothetical protein
MCGNQTHRGVSLGRVLTSILLLAIALPCAAQLRVSENRRHFLDGDKPVALFGSGLWTIIPDTTVDIEEHNAWYAEWRSNANRASLFAFCTAVPDGKGLAPWLRTGPGTANDGLPKFDLTAPNEAFWERAHAYFESCQRHGIYVWLQIFDEPFTEPGEQRWFINPFNDDNNINAIPGMPGGDGGGQANLHGSSEEAFYDPDNAPLMAVQDALVRRLLDETAKKYGHIVYEIGNEINADSESSKALAWQRHWIQFFRAYEREHGLKLLLANNTRRSLAEADADGFDVLNHQSFGGIPVRGVPPRELAANIERHVTGDFARFRQPVVSSRPASDPDRVDYPDIVSPDEGRCLYWSYFMSGGHIIGFRTTVESWKGGLAAETILRHLHGFIDAIPYADMEPISNRTEGLGLGLVAPGKAQAMYFPAGGRVTLFLSDYDAGVTVRWYNPRTGEWAEPAPADTSNGSLTLVAPDEHDWAVLVQSSADPLHAHRIAGPLMLQKRIIEPAATTDCGRLQKSAMIQFPLNRNKGAESGDQPDSGPSDINGRI